jgi:hypothetical protein
LGLHFCFNHGKIVFGKNLFFQGGEMMNLTSTNNMYFDGMYLLDKIKILLDYIGKISARFFVPCISLPKIKYSCLHEVG